MKIKSNFPEKFFCTSFIALKVKLWKFNYTRVNLLRPMTRSAKLAKEQQLEIESEHEKHFRHIIESTLNNNSAINCCNLCYCSFVNFLLL